MTAELTIKVRFSRFVLRVKPVFEISRKVRCINSWAYIFQMPFLVAHFLGMGLFSGELTNGGKIIAVRMKGSECGVIIENFVSYLGAYILIHWEGNLYIGL